MFLLKQLIRFHIASSSSVFATSTSSSSSSSSPSSSFSLFDVGIDDVFGVVEGDDSIDLTWVKSQIQTEAASFLSMGVRAICSPPYTSNLVVLVTSFRSIDTPCDDRGNGRPYVGSGLGIICFHLNFKYCFIIFDNK